MIIKYLLPACYLLLLPIVMYSQADYNFTFLPEGRHFQALKANYQEAKLGVMYYPSTANLKVDVGNSVDLLEFKIISEKIKVTVGIDFFAYALSTSFAGNRLQIDALDGLFGGNAVFSKSFTEDKFFIRFRVLHNSAHLVDGHFNVATNKWIDDDTPMPFTRDFGELLFAYELNNENIYSRIYAGPSYSTLVRPYFLRRWNLITGGEFVLPDLIGKTFKQRTNLFFAYNFHLNGGRKYTGNSNLMAGLKFGDWSGKGIVLYAEYYSGQKRFNEYFYEREEELGIGFNVDF
jgi:hypothetical protein